MKAIAMKTRPCELGEGRSLAAEALERLEVGDAVEDLDGAAHAGREVTGAVDARGGAAPELVLEVVSSELLPHPLDV
jgi:hypothetical protein